MSNELENLRSELAAVMAKNADLQRKLDKATKARWDGCKLFVPTFVCKATIQQTADGTWGATLELEPALRHGELCFCSTKAEAKFAVEDALEVEI